MPIPKNQLPKSKRRIRLLFAKNHLHYIIKGFHWTYSSLEYKSRKPNQLKGFDNFSDLFICQQSQCSYFPKSQCSYFPNRSVPIPILNNFLKSIFSS